LDDLELYCAICSIMHVISRPTAWKQRNIDMD